MNPSTLLAVLQLLSVCFCHLRSLVMIIPRSSCWSVVGNCWLDMLWLLCMLLCPMYITEHLSTLKLICHLLAHSTSLLISSCSSIMSSGFLALWQSLVSSANFDILVFYSFSFSLLCVYRLVLWDWGLRTDKVYITLLSLALPTFLIIIMIIYSKCAQCRQGPDRYTNFYERNWYLRWNLQHENVYTSISTVLNMYTYLT